MKYLFLGLVSYSIFTIILLTVVEHYRAAEIRRVQKPAVPMIEQGKEESTVDTPPEPGAYIYREIRPVLPELEAPTIEQPSTVDTPPGSVPGREAWERVPPDPYYPGADDEIKIEAGNLIELKGGAGNG